MKRITALAFALVALTTAARPAAADFGYGGFGPGYHPYYVEGWRPWWGGLHGWGPYHGCSSYPAYKCAPTSGYRCRPCLYPPSSYYYGYPNYEGGYAQYPRTFVYDWSPDAGDQVSQPRQDLPPQQPYQAP